MDQDKGLGSGSSTDPVMDLAVNLDTGLGSESPVNPKLDLDVVTIVGSDFGSGADMCSGFGSGVAVG